jgi:outer membrane protein assembly factor BamD (BamD/ComL family)
MSADNGIYILKTKDQYRVIHAQAIENLWWSYLTNKFEDEMVPTRIIEYFGDSRFTRSYETAMKVANAIAKDYPVLEYGIKTFEVNETWDQIVKAAKEMAQHELRVLRGKENQKYWESTIKRLEKIISNYCGGDSMKKKKNTIWLKWGK